MTQQIQSQEASMAGVANRISAAEKAAMSVSASPAVLRATIQVTRASTGKVETYEIVGTAGDTPPVTVGA